jgi:hypothetical protein
VKTDYSLLECTGLKRKLGNAEFRDIIKDMDIIGVVETWVEEKDKIEINGLLTCVN